MSIINLHMDFPGQNEVYPRLGRLVTNDSQSTITTAGYLDKYCKLVGIELTGSDIIAATYINSGVKAAAMFNVGISGGVSTLSLY